MNERVPCPSAPGPLEGYAAQFDPLFGTLAQRRGFREYLQGLLLPRDRNKTLTALAGAEPVVAAQAGAVQRLQFFLSESTWDPEAINTRRLALLLSDPATVPHAEGVLVIDDTGDRKAGTHTDHVARQWLGSIGKVDNGIVAVTSLWADERVYYPLHVRPYTPAPRLPLGKKDAAFRTKPQLALELIEAAVAMGVPFRAVVADCAYGDNVNFEAGLWDAGLPYVVSLKPSKGTWAMAHQAHTPEEAARRFGWRGPAHPGDWTPVERRFRNGHMQTWYAADLTFSGYGPERLVRLVVATTDPATLPAISTWYLTTNLPRPASHRAADSPHAPADLAEIVRLYGLRNRVVVGFGLGTALSAFAIASQNAVDVAQMGVATGLGTSGRATGATLGSAGFGSLLVARIGADTVSPPVLAGALHDTFFAAMLVLLIGAVLVLPLHVAANVRNPVAPLIPAQGQSEPAA